jgi:hypothetical protein
MKSCDCCCGIGRGGSDCSIPRDGRCLSDCGLSSFAT